MNFCGRTARYIPKKFIEHATTAELAETIRCGIADASKDIGREIKTQNGRKITGEYIARANKHLLKNVI